LTTQALGGVRLGKQVLTTGEVAGYCGVNFRTVIRWIKRGYLTAFQLPGRGDNRVRVEDFVTFLEENRIPVPHEVLALRASGSGAMVSPRARAAQV